jgi:Cu2+-containing amine oxidase
MKRALLLANALALLFIVSWTALRAKDQQPAGPQPDLTPAERQAAVTLAREALQAKGLYQGKVFLSKVEVFRNADDKGERLVFVTHYRYEGNAALQAVVDLSARKVLSAEALPRFPTPLAPEEAARATELARNHPLVQRMVEEYGKPLTLEALAIVSSEESDPAHTHRVANIFFHEGGYYLTSPHVDVDLTTEQVLIGDRSRPTRGPRHP